jgi:N-acetylglucosamine-6-sulfatase
MQVPDTSRRRWSPLLAIALVGGLLAACGSTSEHSASAPAASTTTTTTPTTVPAPTTTAAPVRVVDRPNIIFILTDDLSSNLVQYMPNVLNMEKNGTSFSNYFVTDSLCCPSRTSILTGEFPHNSGVFENTGADGGFSAFVAHNDTAHTYAVSLHGAGYDTAMMGKYLNGYVPTHKAPGAGIPSVPAGWSQWDVAGNGYPEFNYQLNQNRTVLSYGSQPKDYLTDVLSQRATSLVDTAAAAHTPFALEVASFAPHSPYVPAPQDANLFPNLQAPRTPAFGATDTQGDPKWLQGYKPLTTANINSINADFRKRVQSVQAVDRMIGALALEVAAKGLTKSTYFVFSSDNGFHMGEHRLLPGKMTAFDTDIRVPLVVVGPGVPHGRTVSELAENIDLAPTFDDLAGVPIPPTVDGTSLMPLLLGGSVSNWRRAVLVEHVGQDNDASDPDFQPIANGDPPSYQAVRFHDSVYVEYVDGEREYYNTKADPDELKNVYSLLSPATKTLLTNELATLKSCHGGAACHRAETLPP